MPERYCLTCKHFEPSAVPTKGWCRNPALYAAQQSHSVAPDSLDCARQRRDFWEAAPSMIDDPHGTERPSRALGKRPRLRLFQPPAQLVPAPAGAGIFASFGRGGDEGGRDEPRTPNRTTGGSGTGRPPTSSGGLGGGRLGSGGERPVSFQPSEERYWTDYLRIALPIVGLLLMLALFWFWAAKIIGDENGAEPTAKVPATTVLITPTNPAPTATSKTNITAPEVTATVAQGPDTGAPTPTGNEQATEAPSGETPTEGNAVGKGFAVGDAATVNDDGVNLRSGPTTDSDIVGQLALGDEVKITKAATKVDADGRAWVEVEVQNGDLEGQSGYISDEFLDAE